MNRCPTCDSPAPNLHPAVQCEGEVQICSDSYHRPETDRELDDDDPARPALQNLPGTPAATLERAMACCTPVSCGYHLGKRGSTIKERGDNEEFGEILNTKTVIGTDGEPYTYMLDDPISFVEADRRWQEERRGWTGL